MRSKRLLTIVTGLITVGSFLCIMLMDKGTCEKCYDLVLALFGSAALGCIMSYSEYLVVKKEAMEDFYCEFRKLLTALLQLPVIGITIPMDLFQSILLEDWNNDISKRYHHSNVQKKQLASCKFSKWRCGNQIVQKQSSVETDRQIIRCNVSEAKRDIEKYDDVLSNISIEELDIAFGRLNFFNRKYRKRVYKELYKPLKDLLYKTLGYKTNLHMFSTGSSRNIPVAFQYCLKISDNLYSRTEEDVTNEFKVTVDEKLTKQYNKSLCDFYSRIYHPIKNHMKDEMERKEDNKNVAWSNKFLKG